MVNYNNGKIYKIQPKSDGEEGDIYIGSTTKVLLSQRMSGHRCDYKRWKKGNTNKVTSFNLFDKYGVENCEIVLIEIVNVESKDELIAREKHWIQSTNCVNKIIVGRTPREYRVDNQEAIQVNKKNYHNENKETIQVYKKKYREENKESIQVREKKYREENKEAIQEKIKQYRVENKEALQVKAKKYREENKESIQEKIKQYHVENKEVVQVKKKEHYEKNKEVIQAKKKEHYEKNKEVILFNRKKYRVHT